MNFGIIDLELFFPKVYVSQSDLETYDNVPKGKYTIGLLQTNMSFPLENEDSVSLALNAFDRLLARTSLDPNSIGRLEVGTESSVDKSKSIKTHLMKLFKKSGNYDVLGVDNINACYGATAALFNALSWCHSPFYDGRYAVVVSTDIAIYEKGPARPTGGCGAIAMIIGPDAPIVLENGHGYCSSFFSHDWDFYKPKMSSEFPTVDGKLSITLYLKAIDYCYTGFKKRFALANNTKQNEKKNIEIENEKKTTEQRQFDLSMTDFAIFHSPFNKMVVKSWARIKYNDWFDNNEIIEGIDEELRKKKKKETRIDRNVENAFRNVSKQSYKEKVEKSNYICAQCGNLYTGSLYGALISLIIDQKEQITGKKVLMFSYGSGIASSMFLLKVKKCPTEAIKSCTRIQEMLDNREKISPQMYTKILDKREENLSKFNYNPQWNPQYMWDGAWYLKQIDEKGRRIYEKNN
ncbi:3-hydroxy-3-methylglutaryl coenzyme a synthase [Anaeramoeba flamelloides]|uniref:Hydroxymethylglutaryl-CoA synthase n=1 Tax=Anaeramoeba flamelloides TaxID=1746091 RepID=A0AAV7YL56_9EUKA|nr:3-hydroxy-3-methylglutaryl coenzyme a synthase [Anaeramoeba flamelloides]